MGMENCISDTKVQKKSLRLKVHMEPRVDISRTQFVLLIRGCREFYYPLSY